MLRSYQKEDIFSWQRWDLDEDVQQYMPGPENTPMSDEQQLAYLKECETDMEGIYWSIVWKENQQLIGTISLTDINQYHGVAELGIVIGEKKYWGKGVAREAVRLVLDNARSELELRRITVEYEEENKAMGKVLEENGFLRECVCVASRVKNGKPINTVRSYILLRTTG